MAETPSKVSSGKLLMAAVTALVLGWCFDFFFTQRVPGVSWPLFILLGVAAIAWAYRRRESTWPPMTAWIAAPLLFVALSVAIRASAELVAICILLSMALVLLAIVHLTRKSVFQFSVPDYARAILVPFEWIPSFFSSLVDLLSLRLHLKNQRAVGILKGVLMAIPLLIFFGILFASADLVFKKVVTNVFHISIDPETIFHTVITLFAAAIAFGALTYLLRYRQPAASTSSKTPRLIGSTEINVMLGLVTALFLIFIVIQVAYLFGGQHTITSQGFTYADYARRGFFELIVVGIISFLIVWTAESAMVRHNHARKNFQWLATVLIICVLGIMASAFMRLALYEQAYGFTTTRFYSHAFTIWLGAMFIMLLVKIVHRDSEPRFLRWTYASVVIATLAMAMTAPDAFIARQNLNRLHRTGKIDLDYISTLSTDAVPQQINLLSSSDPATRQAAANMLWAQRQHLDDSFNSSWLSWSWSHHRAKQLLEQQRDQLERYRTHDAPQTTVR